MYCSSCGKSVPDGSAFCLHCGKETGPSRARTSGSNPSKTLWKTAAAIVIVLGAVFILARIYSSSVASQYSSSSNPIQAVLHPPVVTTIFSGELVVKAGQYRFWTVSISPQMANAQLYGSFHASGGSGNDIQAVIADESEFENWKNEHQARAYYSTGKTTNGQFSVRLPPGTYVVAFSNAFSILTDKEVSAQIHLRYLK